MSRLLTDRESQRAHVVSAKYGTGAQIYSGTASDDTIGKEGDIFHVTSALNQVVQVKQMIGGTWVATGGILGPSQVSDYWAYTSYNRNFDITTTGATPTALDFAGNIRNAGSHVNALIDIKAFCSDIPATVGHYVGVKTYVTFRGGTDTEPQIRGTPIVEQSGTVAGPPTVVVSFLSTNFGIVVTLTGTAGVNLNWDVFTTIYKNYDNTVQY